MFSHLILGLLRNGEPRHGYDLITEYSQRSGHRVSSGNFYRELGRLAEHSMVQTGVNPPAADARRIPYQITEQGRHTFDQWLVSPSTQEDEFPGWLLFIERVPADVRERLLERRQEALWVESKALAQARDDALRAAASGARRYDPLPAILLQRIMQVTAQIEFFKELRAELAAWFAGETPSTGSTTHRQNQKQKGTPRP